jgi:ABC-2 type transport system permease protein
MNNLVAVHIPHLFSLVRIYAAIWRIAVSTALEYRTNFFATGVWMCLSSFVSMSLWTAVYTSSAGFSVGNMNLRTVLTYIAVAMTCATLTQSSRHERDASEDIRTGDLNKYLLRPVSHIGYIMASSLGHKAVQVLFTALVVLCVGVPLAVSADVSLSWKGVLYALPILAFGAFMHGFLALTLSYFAFWFDEVWTFHAMKDIALGLAAGMIMPLSALPPAARALSDWLPFQYFAYVPASLIVGTIPAESALMHYTKALGWTLVMFGIAVGVWKQGLKRFGAYGG